MLLETVPLIALAGISFGGSFGNILNFFGACGITGIFRYGDTACPDLLCLVAAREILRDRRICREKSRYASWPVMVLVIGITMTLALGFIGADKRLLAHIAGSWAGHIPGLLPGAVLLLVLSILHRRDAGTGVSGTRSERRRAPAGTGTGDAKPSVPVPSRAPAAEGLLQAWTDDDLIAEARRQWAEHAAMGVRLSQARFEMALKQSPRGGAGRPRVIEALKAVRAEMDGAGDGHAAVAR